MTTDVHTWIGGYPFRDVSHPDPDVLVRVLEREGLHGAWVGHLPSAFWRDPSPGNDALYKALEPHHERLRPMPCIRPDWPAWERSIERARAMRAPGVRAYPPQWGMDRADGALREFATACGESRLVLLLTVRFEDARQRHWMDSAGDVSGALVRGLVRASASVRVVVCAAGRALVEEVHWGLTPEERARLWWDISWLWGPPEDDLAHLFRSVGADRFVYGTGWPLRLTQAPRANLALLPDDVRGASLADANRIASDTQFARAR